MRDEKLFLEFINFCESQPEDKQIDHDTWDSCAVGKFADSITVSILSGRERGEFLRSLFGHHSDSPKNTMRGDLSQAMSQHLRRIHQVP